MAATYSSQTRESIFVKNTSNEAVELTDGTTAYRFGPGEGKAVNGELAVRLAARDSRLQLPDTTATGNLFVDESPLNQIIKSV